MIPKGALEDAFLLERRICGEVHADCFSRRALCIWFAAFRRYWWFICMVSVTKKSYIHFFCVVVFYQFGQWKIQFDSLFCMHSIL